MRLLSMVLLFSIVSCKGEKPGQEVSVEQTPQVTKISVEDAYALLQESADVIFLDVRTPEETSEGKIPGAMEINVKGDDFKLQVNKLDKDRSYVVYCRSGMRSRKASDIMLKNGFKDLSMMKGGYLAWEKIKK